VSVELKGLAQREWTHMIIDIDKAAPKRLRRGDTVREVTFLASKGVRMWVDDLLLYEPAK
jgi:hypothetical protein